MKILFVQKYSRAWKVFKQQHQKTFFNSRGKKFDKFGIFLLFWKIENRENSFQKTFPRMMTGQWSRCILPLFLFHLSSLSLSFSDSLSLLHALTRSPHTSAHTNTQFVRLLFEVVFSSNPPPNTSGKPPTRRKFSIRKKGIAAVHSIKSLIHFWKAKDY